MDLILAAGNRFHAALPETDHACLAFFRIYVIGDDFIKKTVDFFSGVIIFIVRFLVKTYPQLLLFGDFYIWDQSGDFFEPEIQVITGDPFTLTYGPQLSDGFFEIIYRLLAGE